MNNDERIIAELESLNREVKRQNSLLRMFAVGICYGVGFFVGSAVVATIAFGILAPWVGEIPWIHKAYVTGLGILHSNPESAPASK